MVVIMSGSLSRSAVRGGAGLLGVQLDVVIHLVEQQHFSATIHRALDVVDVFVCAGWIRRGRIMFFDGEWRVPFGMQGFHVLRKSMG